MNDAQNGTHGGTQSGQISEGLNHYKALRMEPGDQVAFVGAGGKTTALFQLARACPGPVVVTTSTHLGAWQASFADRQAVIARVEDIERFTGQIEGVTLFSGPPGPDERLTGLDEQELQALSEAGQRLGFPVLVEADGSRERPLKAPAENEPAIPGWVDTVVVVAGLSGLGKPLAPETVHRAERFAQLSGIAIGEPVTAEGLARVLIHPQGGLKNIPSDARKVLLLNQADHEEIKSAALRVATLAADHFDRIIIASLAQQEIRRVIEPTAGVILAGGGASRYGQPKLLLPWKGKALIRHVAEAALSAGLNQVVVVTGAEDESIRQVLSGLPVMLVHNPDWQAGQSTSVRRGVEAMLERVGSALFLLGDQPLVSVDLIQALIDLHQRTLAPVIAPRVQGKRSNPVLFDQSVFPHLLQLQGDAGGRSIFGQYPIEFVDWPDTNLLLDVDTPEDYQRLQGLE